MIKAILSLLPVMVLASMTATSAPAAEPHKGPQAAGRTYAQNYKDMVLAQCIDQAYGSSAAITKDAGSSVSALRDWTYYDIDAATAEIPRIINRYLQRDYANPLAEAELKGVKFDLLKCLDLYHGPELQEQVEKFVEHPDRSWRQDQDR